jgi:hypothetical protein
MKTRRKKISIVLGLFILIAFGPVTAFGGTILSFDPLVTSVAVGDTLDVSVMISEATDLYAFQFDVAFDPTIIRISSVNEGPFLLTGGTTTFDPAFITIDNSVGSIAFIFNSLIGNVPGVSGSAHLIDLEFQPNVTGTSLLTLSNVLLLDSTLREITLDEIRGGSIDVSTPVPEPATIILMGFGSSFMGIGIKRLRNKLRKTR